MSPAFLFNIGIISENPLKQVLLSNMLKGQGVNEKNLEKFD